MEIWRDIKGYEGCYQVSNMGRVKSLSRVIVRSDGQSITVKERILSESKNDRGYYGVRISKNGKQSTPKIHSLVANAFIPNPQNLKEVNHKDGNKKNNYVDNLEWSTRSHNIKHAFDNGLNTTVGENNPRSVLTELDVVNIRDRRDNGELEKSVYKDYSNKIGISGFKGVWNDRTWKTIKN